MKQPLRVPINLDDLILALTSGPGVYTGYLDLQTGEILFLPEGLADYGPATKSELAGAFDFGADEMIADAMKVINEPRRFIVIQPFPSWRSYNLMKEFVETLPPGRLQAKLDAALAGRKPFRRFKDVLLAYPRERQAWFDFQNEHQRQWAVEWLDEHGIEID
jgi:hypothetical protein